MSNILLIEPAYRSKFPPLGLLRLSSYHKSIGDNVTFARGKMLHLKELMWHRIYVSSLFTYELPRTVDTINYYSSSVDNPSEDIYVGGIGATLLPGYINERTTCKVKVIEGPLNLPNMIGPGTPPIDQFVPDYALLNSVDWDYKPRNSYFVRVTIGCIRSCDFCAVPILEQQFGFSKNLNLQINEVIDKFGEQQDLVILDNNILAIDNFENIINDIQQAGFGAHAKRNNRKRIVDFNQGLDARLVTPKIASLLASICLDPVRLAFDFIGMEKIYRNAMISLIDNGFVEFTNYVMFNYNDTPESLYHRMRVNIELSEKHSVRVTSFPMRYIPIYDVNRHYVSDGWRWRYLRGIQCVLNATHGMVSPNPKFFDEAFGKSYEEFLEIISMPDHYIIYRNKYKNNEALEWKSLYRKLTSSEKEELLLILETLNGSKNRDLFIPTNKKLSNILRHYQTY